MIIKGLSNEQALLLQAKKGKYGVGAFNFTSVEIMRAIVDGCQQKKSPVILALSSSAMKYVTLPYVIKVVQAATETSNIPIALHLDHGKDWQTIKECVDVGFSSVMIDGSFLPFDENVELTKKVCSYAHRRGVAVEGELGVLAGVEDEVSADKNHYTNPEQALEFVERTGVDSLAVAIGTSHGAFKFKGEPMLRFDLLKDIEKLLPKTPIVLHGASSVPLEFINTINRYGGNVHDAQGLPDELLKKACKSGVCKVNCDTDLRLCYTAALREFFANNPNEFNPRKYLEYAKLKVAEFVAAKTKVLGSAGKAR